MEFAVHFLVTNGVHVKKLRSTITHAWARASARLKPLNDILVDLMPESVRVVAEDFNPAFTLWLCILLAWPDVLYTSRLVHCRAPTADSFTRVART